MAEMDVLQSKIIQQIETYLTEQNIKNDYYLSKLDRENNGWIPLERLNQFNKLSTFKFDTLLNALRAKRSNLVELSSFQPICVRRRRKPPSPPLRPNLNLDRTVVITGLPRDVKHEELVEFFNRFYPVMEIEMLRSSRTANSFCGKIRILFQNDQNARDFVYQSESKSILYVNDYVWKLCNGYTLVCKMLADCDDREEEELTHNKSTDQHPNGQSFSTRLASFKPRVTFENSDDHPKPSSALIPQKRPFLGSRTCATEQILFCQNPANAQSTAMEVRESLRHEPIASNRFSYEFYVPDHLFKQTRQCLMVAALNPHCFTIQLKQDAFEFDHFQREINDFYDGIDDELFFVTPEQIRLNLCVMCADPNSPINDHIWNRSQILDFDPIDNTVNLFYVDLGTWDEYVPLHRLRHILDRHHRHVVFSLTCQLANIIPLTLDVIWPQDAIDQFLAVIEKATPEIELLGIGINGCFETNLFVFSSGQYVCVNDYLIHIKKAQAILNTNPMNKVNKQNSPWIHPVIALYNKLGEDLQSSLAVSRATSGSSSSVSSTAVSPRSVVKLIHVKVRSNVLHRRELNSIQQTLPIVFVRYQTSILVPDFNICNLLQTTNSTINISTIEDHALAIRYDSVHITRESDPEIFTQLNLLTSIRFSASIALYALDFVRYILERNNFRVASVFIALENAKIAQMHASDLALWFATDNELKSPSTPLSDHSDKINHSDGQSSHTPSEDEQSPVKRLPFSNRLISPT